MRKIFIAAIFFTFSVIGFAQQRPVISTYMFNGLALNPAYAGSLNIFSASFIHRKQWINVEGAPASNIFSANTSLYGNQLGLGILLSRDDIGVHQESAFYLSGAYKIRTGGGILAMGLSGGFDNRKSDFNQLNILNEDDQLLTGTPTQFTPNFGTGLYFANPVMYAGISVPYILENTLYDVSAEGTVSEAKESRYYYATGGFIFSINQNVKFSPSTLIRYQDNSRIGWDLNGTLIFDGIAYAGISYRSGDALIFLTQLILNENFRIGYAYDTTVNPLNDASRGTHEILLNYRIKINLTRDPQCPVYF
ncbi:MAG: type IX secretion system membrane protein PorP/SprF [Ekhidna sp.]|nr:type IX secretion system membrane protein PorP/SprF [Ekhidna sp.]MBC6409307.1 type IX secretion system membrane protein PorP/SprF [Ekhidna sp.]MBC6426202.1 type IX secretion system membrane protein PorP/SprF [Ekhidna sp.]